MKIKFVGISGVLESGAKGHFESFHRALHTAAGENKNTAEVIYLGARSSVPDWFQNVIPHFYASKFSRGSNLLRKKIQSEVSQNYITVFHQYEGNLSNLFFLSKCLLNSSNSRIILNFFDSSKYLLIIENPLRRRIFLIALTVLERALAGRIYLTMDTQRMSEAFNANSKINIGHYPVYSILTTKNQNIENKTGTLILLRGTKSYQKLVELLLATPKRLHQEITVHGLISKKETRFIQENFSIKISQTHLLEEDYEDYYSYFKKVVFLYDPEIFKYQSSGRLCDSIVSKCHLIVPINTSLSDTAALYGNYTEFHYDDLSSLKMIILDNTTSSFSRNDKVDPTPDVAFSELMRRVELLEPRSVSSVQRALFILIFYAFNAFNLIRGITLQIRSGVWRRIGNRSHRF